MLFLHWILGKCVRDKEFTMDIELFPLEVLILLHEKKMGLNTINILYF